MWYLLNQRERDLVRQLDVEFATHYHRSPDDFDDLFYFLGDRFEWSKSWSASSGVLPCYRKNSAKYVQRSTMMALTPCDKLASLGWPVTPGTATQMLTTQMPSLDPKRSAHMAGNSMHLQVASIVLLVAFSCYGPKASQT